MSGTGFSRMKCSVRSRARPAFCLVCSQVSLTAVEIFLDARRNCCCPSEPGSSSCDCIGVESGSSLVRSFSFGVIILWNRKLRFLCSLAWQATVVPTRRDDRLTFWHCLRRSHSATTNEADHRACLIRPREQRSLC